MSALRADLARPTEWAHRLTADELREIDGALAHVRREAC